MKIYRRANSKSRCIYLFSLEHNTTQTLTNMHVTLTPMNVHMHLRETEPADLEVNEVTTDVSLFTGTPPTTESIATIKS
jgi:hypothetical protein